MRHLAKTAFALALGMSAATGSVVCAQDLAQRPRCVTGP
jgi:hypothetical protein